MQKTFMAKEEEIDRRWWEVDASGKILGRLATEVARILQGKHKPIYTPHVDTGDHVVVTNAAKILTTGNKRDDKEYAHYSGYPGGRRTRSMAEFMDEDPEDHFRTVVRRMLPKKALGARMLKKLRVHAGPGPDHGYEAQQIQPLEIEA